MLESSHYFYVLYCQDGSLYAGYTNDLNKRLQTHNAGKGAKYTQPPSRRPVQLIYAESFTNKSLAMKQEYWFKQLNRMQKISYLREQGQASIEGSGFVMINRHNEERLDDEDSK